MKAGQALATAAVCAAFAATAGGCRPQAEPAPDAPRAHLLIRDVRIVDGSGAPAFEGDIRVSRDHIAEVGQLEPGPDDAVFDGRGLTLAPGFIDTHSHAGRDLLAEPEALPALSQGITTIVIGQDGASPLPLADYFAELDATPVAINVAAYAGHNTIRSEVLGEDYRRAAKDEEVEAMSALLQRELAAGALGLSTGLEYDPGIWSDPSEVLVLAEVAAASGGRYISHIRSEDRWLERALDEIIDIGRITGMPVQVSHIKLAMKRLWGEAPRIVAKLDAARADGVRISADIYPYEYWQSDMMVLLPERDYTDRAAVVEALDEIAPPDGLWFTQFEPQPEYVGKTLAEIAALREVDAATAFMQLAGEAARVEEETGRGADAIIGTSMREEDIRQLLLWEETNICTDGAFDDLHPRARGAFARVLGRYVREEKLLSLEEAVHRMTGLAAEHMNFTDRGVLRAGARADLVLFDPQAIADRATPETPELLSEGVAAVWVAGELVYADGRATGALPGAVVRRSLR